MTNADKLRHLSWAILHAIHSVFPPTAVTRHNGADPIALKKLLAGDGIWDVQKEILGWVFNGIKRCMWLPEKKIESLLEELHKTAQSTSVLTKTFEKLRGHLRHACVGLPAGRGLMGPIDNALASPPRLQISIKSNELLRTSLRDFHMLIKMIGHRPMMCCELIPDTPDYIGYCDASKLGAGGAWLPGRRSLAPVVWRLEFPPDIQAS
jgi:hypothetical protein